MNSLSQQQLFLKATNCHSIWRQPICSFLFSNLKLIRTNAGEEASRLAVVVATSPGSPGQTWWLSISGKVTVVTMAATEELCDDIAFDGAFHLFHLFHLFDLFDLGEPVGRFRFPASKPIYELHLYLLYVFIYFILGWYWKSDEMSKLMYISSKFGGILWQRGMGAKPLVTLQMMFPSSCNCCCGSANSRPALSLQTGVKSQWNKFWRSTWTGLQGFSWHPCRYYSRGCQG